ncbi:MAG TPA: PspC domain-containing protein [bacterium]|nr:PspC domain-containing protein [bacterium]
MRPRLYRSRSDYWIAGVCGGLGRYFGVDSNPIRLGFVVLAAWNGLGVLLYLMTVLIVPEEPVVGEPGATPGPVSPPAPGRAPVPYESRRVRMLGWLLILGGAYLLLRNLHLFIPIVQDEVFPVVLILGGLVLLLMRSESRR